MVSKLLLMTNKTSKRVFVNVEADLELHVSIVNG